MRQLCQSALNSVSGVVSRVALCAVFILPWGVSATMPTPAEHLGFELGRFHVRHDQIEAYARVAAAAEPQRVKLEVIGRTHEQRPVLQLVISSAENMARLEQIRAQHLAQVLNGSKPDPALPLVVWLGYGVHGNESSSANASMQVLYQLLNSNEPEIKAWLDHTVILIQPSLNPDGHDRFAIWSNMHQGQSPVADPQHREHIEPWPSGRPNHYWFDLNRDWLPLQHPESQARIQQFHRWKPQVLADFHEMGPNSSYFFQPGIVTRSNPETPAMNFELTKKIAAFHAKAFDAQQKLYFTEEAYDDFYVGKGSTYPDVQGSIGILFEQASSRGHLQDTINGPLAFRTTIDNQVLTSMSTLRGAAAHRQELQQWQIDFYQQAVKDAAADPQQGYLLSDDGDSSRLNMLLATLQQHQIAVYPLTEDVSLQGKTFRKAQSYYLPLQQPQYRLIKAALSTATDFKDNTFYDVSAWTLPYAYNVQFAVTKKAPAYEKQSWQATKQQAAPLTPGAYAYALRWTDQKAPLLLAKLLAQNIQVRAALKPFSAVTSTGIEQFAAGTMLIPAGLQSADWFSQLSQTQQQIGLPLTAIQSGMTPLGQDVGSQQMWPVKPASVLVFAGPGVNSTEAGEAWFNLERLAGLSPTLAEPGRLTKMDLNRYSHIVLVDGSYPQWQAPEAALLKAWVKAGGVLYGQKGAVSWLAKQGILQAKVRGAAELKALIQQPNANYQDKEQLAGKQRIAGAIYQAELDLSHPLSFGLPRAELPLFKNDLMLIQLPEQDFVTVGRYSARPQLAGYTAPEFVAQIANSAALVAHNLGDGRVIALADDAVFRGYFVGSSRLLVNAIYLGKSFDSAGQGDDSEE